MLSYSKLWLCLLITLGCSYRTAVDAQVYSLGSCPGVNVVSNFDVDKYTGKWYENRNYFAIFQAGLDCVTAEYTKSDTGVTVKNEGIRKIFRTKSIVTGTARQLEAPNGKLGVTFASIPFAPVDSPYWVLGTDYTSYSVVWSCTNRGIFNSQIAWILTRDQFPSTNTINTALAVLAANGISQNPLKTTTQNNC
ncbi:apolipoprotein D-like [Daphnia pulicaria]|uniref:apolipoprotein D-like n=1 Tax=Daphnia pulicaria TaxID=35523 RepID=UPI001EEB72D3|nr:apolipoprotein D-like [Daphnia pulicaria]